MIFTLSLICSLSKFFLIADDISSIIEHDEFNQNIKNEFNLIKPSSFTNFEIDFHRLNEIHKVINECNQKESLNSHYEIFPIPLAEIIEEYEHFNVAFKNLNDQVMDKLEITRDCREYLDFHNESFADKLDPFLKDAIKFSNDDSFWPNLGRLFFKWIIHMRQQLDDYQFSKIIFDIKLVTFKFYSKSHLNIPLGFDLKNSFSCSISNFISLLNSEFFENPWIFPLFPLIIESFYDKENGMNRMNCNEFKFKYFKGNYNKNILLKYFIVLYDPKGKMRKCLIEDDQNLMEMKDSFPLLVDVKISDYLDELKLNKGIPRQLEMINMRHINIFTIKFFESHCQRFLITDSVEHINLLRRLKELNLLSKETMERLIAFKSENDYESINWNKEKFIECILDYEKDELISIEESNECSEYLDLVN